MTKSLMATGGEKLHHKLSVNINSKRQLLKYVSGKMVTKIHLHLTEKNTDQFNKQFIGTRL